MADATCEKCGEPNELQSEFCGSCGEYLGWQGRAGHDGTPAATTRVLDPREIDGYRQDAESRRRHEPDVTARPAPALPSTRLREPLCPACGADVVPGRRFCSRCGGALAQRTRVPAAASAPLRVQTGWWAPQSRAARRAYRRSLPMRYRVTRVAAVAALVAVTGGFLAVAGHNPAGWLRNAWYAARGTLVPVAGLTARADPPSHDRRLVDYPAAAAVDGRLDAWATPWKGRSTAAPAACGALRPGASALMVVMPEPVTVRGLAVVAGLPDDNARRAPQRRPRSLDLTFSDGTCQRIALADQPGFQTIPVTPVLTQNVALSIAAVTPEQAPDPLVSLTEVRLLRRPG